MKKSSFRIILGILLWIAAIVIWEYVGFILGAIVALVISPRGFYSY